MLCFFLKSSMFRHYKETGLSGLCQRYTRHTEVTWLEMTDIMQQIYVQLKCAAAKLLKT